MLIATVVLLPVAAGAAAWAAAARVGSGRRRRVTGWIGATGLAATLAVAVAAAVVEAGGSVQLGPGWVLTAETTALAGVVAVLVPAVALPVVVYAVGHEQPAGLPRLVAGLTAFVGAMELLVLAADLLTLLIGWELVGALSYALISHEWRDASVPRRAAHAFNATRLGDLGLFAAAGAAVAGVGALDYAALTDLTGWQLHLLVGGVVLAAAAKSAQGPFAPWLFSAMAGPSPVSALLHAATMVAAGAYVLARLHPVLELASWFAPVVIGIGLMTALAGGAVAALQTHAKKLLAASTSAQYGLMFVAVGAGFPAAAGAHLVAHAAFKSLLFLVAGIALAATGSATLGRHRLGSHLRVAAAASAVGSLSLAAVPPLGAAWTKEGIVAAAGHAAPWLAVAVTVAGGLSALYAARFHLLAYGTTTGDARTLHRPGRAARGGAVALAVGAAALVVLFVPGSKEAVAEVLGGELPAGRPWELVLSLALVAAGAWTAVVADRRGRLASLGTVGPAAGAAEWLGLPTATKRAAVDPALGLAAAAARFDDRVVDAGVRAAAAAGAALSTLLAGPDPRALRRSRLQPRTGVETRVDGAVGAVAAAASRLAALAARFGERLVDGAVGAVAAAGSRLAALSDRFGERLVDGVVEATASGVGAAGRDSRRLQTGMVHHYFVLIVLGVVVLVVVAAVWR